MSRVSDSAPASSAPARHQKSRNLLAPRERSEPRPLQTAPEDSQPLAGSSLEPVLRDGKPRIPNDLESLLAAKVRSDPMRRIVLEKRFGHQADFSHS